jgi:hypothetical protein
MVILAAAVWVACGSDDGVKHERQPGDGGAAGAEGPQAVAGEPEGGQMNLLPAGGAGAGGETTVVMAGAGGDHAISGFGGEGASGAGAGGTGGEGGATPVLVEVKTHFKLTSQLCGLGFDSAQQLVWVYPCFGATLSSYSPAGVAGVSVERPGESADDVDLDFSPIAFTLGAQALPAQTALFFNGETAGLDIYAVNVSGTSAVPLATQAMAFGDAHVVGGAFHAKRGTFFAVQDRVPGATLGNRVAELSPLTGALVNVFSVAPSFDVNYGDLEVCQATGNLFVVSSTESVVAEYTPTGELLNKYPADVDGLSGIAMDDSTGEAWVAAPAGDVWQLGGLPCPPFEP